jgi:hypothetical protein
VPYCKEQHRPTFVSRGLIETMKKKKRLWGIQSAALAPLRVRRAKYWWKLLRFRAQWSKRLRFQWRRRLDLLFCDYHLQHKCWTMYTSVGMSIIWNTEENWMFKSVGKRSWRKSESTVIAWNIKYIKDVWCAVCAWKTYSHHLAHHEMLQKTIHPYVFSWKQEFCTKKYAHICPL